MMSYEEFQKSYGLNPMSLAKEMNAPANIKSTRNAKISCTHTLEHIIRTCEGELSRTRRIPELDDDHHAEIVRKYERCIKNALNCLEEIHSIN